MLPIMKLVFVALAVCWAGAAHATENSVQYTGVNIAGGDFTVETMPGTYGLDYAYPDPDTIAYFAAKGMNIIRVPVRWERIQHQLNGDLDEQEMGRTRRCRRFCRIQRHAGDSRCA